MKTLVLLTGLILAVSSARADTLACDNKNPRDWQSFADSLISLDGFLFVQSNGSVQREIERAVVQNALINASYTNQVIQHQEAVAKGAPRSFYWISSAPFVSHVVGRALRDVYRRLDGLKAHANSSSLSKAVLKTYLDLEPTEKETKNKTLFLDVGRRLSRGNVAVYRDLWWQHHAASLCGPQKTVELLTKLIASEDNPINKSRYEKLRIGWRLLKIASESMPFNRALALEGNIALLRVEQMDVLQRLTYDVFLVSELASKRVRHLAVQPIPDPMMQFPSFVEWSDITGTSKNFIRYENRIRWVEPLVRAQGDYFDRVDDRHFQRLLESILIDSSAILADYHHAGR